MIEIQSQIDKLTKSQMETFTILVRLGDSKELALKTVLEIKPNTSSDLYELAYYS